MKVEVHFDTSEMTRGFNALGRKFPRAVRRAVKRAGTSARTVMVKEMGKDTGLPARRIKADFKTTPLGDSGVRLEVTGRRLPLIDFKAKGPEPSRGRGRGVSYKLPGGRGRAPHAFIANLRGRRGVFRRRTTARGPLVELHGPSLVHVFGKFLPLGAERGRQALVKNLRSEIAFATR